MKKYFILACIIASTLAFKKSTDEIRPAAVSAAINKSLPLLHSSSHTFLKNAAAMIYCHSCHNQGLGLVTFSMAKEKDFTRMIQFLMRQLTVQSVNGKHTAICSRLWKAMTR